MFEEIKAWFKNSETILWARLQVVSGFVLGVLSTVDFQALFTMDWSNAASRSNVAWVAAAMMINGAITEVLRRRNSDL